MTAEHVFQKVYCWCCHNSEKNKQWDTFIEETEERIKTVTDRDLHQTYEFCSFESILLVECKVLISCEHVNTHWQSTKTSRDDVSDCQNFAFCFNVSKISSTVVSFGSSFEFFQVKKLFKNENDCHD